MKSKISFYSFKDTQNNITTHKFRKNKQSHFEQFQKIRVNQHSNELIKNKTKHRKAGSYSILVRSQQEKQLLNFLKLPKVGKSRSLRKSKSKSRMSFNDPQIVTKTPLDRILNNKSKFLKTYFSNLKQFKETQQRAQVKHVFPQIKINDWTIKGYLMGQFILLKALHPSHRQKYLKYKYQSYIQQVKTSYEQFVRQKMQEYILLSYEI